MPRRNTFDLGHLSFMTGKIGRLQTIDLIPVYAGDSISYSLQAMCALSPLRQQLALDPRVDMFAFFRPHRHTYGSNWENFVKLGQDENVTFPADIVNQPEKVESLGVRFPSTTVPRYAFEGYKAIWNRYFRDPGSADRTDSISTFQTSDDDAKYGWTTCHLPAYWNLGLPDIKADVAAERRVTSGASFDVLDIDKARARYGSEAEQEWFAQRNTYHDVMKAKWNTRVSKEIDEYPRILNRQTQWMSGMTVVGIDEVGRASQTGSTQLGLRFGFPRFAVPEHGAIFVMMVMRYPPVVYNETNRKAFQGQLTWKDNAAEDRLLQFDTVRDAYFSEFWRSGDNSNRARVLPDNFHYRYHPNRVHNDFQKLEGFPILDNKSRIGPYIDSQIYDRIFSTRPLAHWHFQGKVNSMVARTVPSDSKSIFVGAR